MLENVKLLILDNRDSFTYNLLDAFRNLPNIEWEVMLTSDFRASMIREFDAMVISPGPGLPSEMKGLSYAIQRAKGVIPILGVCLGMQALAMDEGMGLSQLKHPLHGRELPLNRVQPGHPLFRGLSTPLLVGHYHSWYIPVDQCPDDYEVLADNGEGMMLAMAHRTEKIWAVQFHPESYLTPQGEKMLLNFVNWVMEKDWNRNLK